MESMKMNRITRELAPAIPMLNMADWDWTPIASVDLEFEGEKKSVNIRLQGAIAGMSSENLEQFLKEISSFPANRWTLEMQDLKVLSGLGVRKLVRFAKYLRRRGFELEVRGVHRNVYAILQDANSVQQFAWMN